MITFFQNKHFRGSIADLRLWDTVLSHSRIKANVLQISSTGHDYTSTNGSHLVVHERFASLLYWDPIDIRHPNLVSCDFNEFKKSAYVVDLLQKPSCGKTVIMSLSTKSCINYGMHCQPGLRIEQ